MSPMPGSYISDENGEPWPFYAKGGDPAEPEKIEMVYLEVRPGGMTVARRLPNQHITVAPDPIPRPSLSEVESARFARMKESEERERQAIAEERNVADPHQPESERTQAAVADLTVDDGSESDGESDEEREEREAREATARRPSGRRAKTGTRR